MKIILFLFLSLINQSMASDRILKWIGRYPDDVVGKTTLLNYPPIKNQIHSMVKAQNFELLRPLLYESVQTPVKKINDILVFSLCEPHNCSDHAYYFYYFIKNKELSICHFYTNQQMVSKGVWYGKKIDSKYADDKLFFCRVFD